MSRSKTAPLVISAKTEVATFSFQSASTVYIDLPHGQRLLHLVNISGDQDVGNLRFPAHRIANEPVRADEINGPSDDQSAASIETRNAPSFVDQNGKGKLIFSAKAPVAGISGRVDAKHERVAVFDILPLVAELAKLAGTDGRVIAGIENQNDVIAVEVRERNGISILIPRSEIGSGRSDG